MSANRHHPPTLPLVRISSRWGAWLPSEKVYTVLRRWTDRRGVSWIKLDAGMNTSGQRLVGSLPEQQVEYVKKEERRLSLVGLLPIALIPIPPAIFAANAKAVEEGHLTIWHGIVTALFLLAVLAATTIAIFIVRWSLNRSNKANPSHQPPPNGGRLDGVVGSLNQDET